MISVINKNYTRDEVMRLIDAFDRLNAECCEVFDGVCDTCEYKTLCRDIQRTEQSLLDRVKAGFYSDKKRVHRSKLRDS